MLGTPASANDVYGAKLASIVNRSGAATFTANNAYTLYIADSVPSSISNQYGLYIEKANAGNQ